MKYVLILLLVCISGCSDKPVDVAEPETAVSRMKQLEEFGDVNAVLEEDQEPGTTTRYSDDYEMVEIVTVHDDGLVEIRRINMRGAL